MVLPNPTSSARIAPLDNGDLKANSAASIWWGVKSTCASCRDAVSLPKLSEGRLRVNQCAKYFACGVLNVIFKKETSS